MTSQTQGAPAQGSIYDPAIALEFFKAAGKPQDVAQGTTLFAENEKARPIRPSTSTAGSRSSRKARPG